ncbi:hypothetical protein ACIA8M_25885 [Streptomyces anulatus]
MDGARYAEEPAIEDIDAARFYDRVRANPSSLDISAISQNTGIRTDILDRVRTHFFLTEHIVTDAPGSLRKAHFTPRSDIAEIWEAAKGREPFTEMHIVGFFEELWPPSLGAPVGSVHDFTSSIPYEDSREIIKYLLAGHDLFSVMGSSRDVLGSDETVLGGDSIFSDGDWIWRGDLCFYMRKYNVRLPDAFLAHARDNKYLMPTGKVLELRELAQKVQDGLLAGTSSPRSHTDRGRNGP